MSLLQTLNSPIGGWVMSHRGWVLLGVTCICVLAGCGSSDDGEQQLASMDEMAAAVERPAVAADRVAAPADNESDDESESRVPKAADPSLPTKRGFALEDLSDEAAYVMVKADAGKVAEALAKSLNGKVIKDAWGKDPG